MSTESAELEAVTAVIASTCDVSVVDLEGVVSSSNEDVMGDLGVVFSTMLARLDFSLACFCEKVSNLSIFVMHLATMESEFEALDFEDQMGLVSLQRVLEFDLLCGVLDSVVRELGAVLETLHAGIAEARERVCSCTHLGDVFATMQDKLLDYEQLLKQSEEQFDEIKIQSAGFERTLSSFRREEKGNGEAGEFIREDDKSLNVTPELTLQTVEQQRYILRMLEKSLAREMDLEKNIHHSREIQEQLKLRMFFLEQAIVEMEEEASDVWERWFEADNAREILSGISKGLLGRLQISQFNLIGLSRCESELRAKLENLSSLEKQLKESEFELLNAKASADECQNQYNAVCSEVRDMGTLIVELKEAVSNAESRANSAEAKCKLLTETNSKLNEELACLNGDGGLSAKVDLLERQLKESNQQLQNTVASAKSSQEKQCMLYSTIRDRENVIKDLKSKVSKAESRADSSEENCIILSESNAELNEELSFLRSRLGNLEGSLHREEEAKMAIAKDIGKQTNVLKTLVKQLAVDRERLKQQLSSLASENKVLIVKLKQTYKNPS